MHDEQPYTEADLKANREQIAEFEQHLKNAQEGLATFARLIGMMREALGRNMTDGEQVQWVNLSATTARQILGLNQVLDKTRDFCYEHVAHGCKLGLALVDGLDMPPNEVEYARLHSVMHQLAQTVLPRKGGGQ